MSLIDSQKLTDLIADRLLSEYDINPELLHDSTASTIIDNLVQELNKANNKTAELSNKVEAAQADMLDTNAKIAKGIKVAEAVSKALRDDSEPDFQNQEPTPDAGMPPAGNVPMQMPDIPEPPAMPMEQTAPMPESTPVNPNVLEGVGGGY